MTMKRNYGIDLLRVVSMLGIIGLHIIGQGGLLSNVIFGTPNYYIIYLFEILFYSSVNIFAMITGYLYVNKEKINNSNLISLIIQIMFYCILITLVFYLFDLFSVRTLGFEHLLYSLFPPLAGRYWYIVCYIFVFLMIPYLNILINNLSVIALKKLLFVILILLSIVTTFGFIDYFKINSGYSPFWLIFCYMFGAYINKMKYNIFSRKKCIIILFISILFTLIFNVGIIYLTKKIFGEPKAIDMLLTYVSPTIVLNSFCIFILFKSIKIESKRLINILLKLSNAAFAVYCIHCHYLMYDYIFKSNFIFILNYSTFLIVLLIPLMIILIYLICFTVEQIRVILFKWLKVDNFCKKLDLYFNIVFNFFLTKI